MVACPSCGKEMSTDKKFCEECGTALPRREEVLAGKESGSGTVKPARAGLQEPPGTDTKKSGKLPIKMIAGGIAVVVILALIGLYGLPLLTGSGQPVTVTVATPVPTMAPTTALPTATQIMAPVTVTTPPAIEIFDERSGMTYLQVYHSTQNFTNGKLEVITRTVQTPPLLIRFNISPQMIVHDKIINHGLSTERTVTENIPDPLSFFEIDILDASTGTVIERHGFNKDFDPATKQEFMVRSGGEFRIQMSGNRVSADVQILTGKP